MSTHFLPLPCPTWAIILAFRALCTSNPGARTYQHELHSVPEPEPCAGTFYFLEFCLGFHVGFVGICNGQRKLVMDGSAIARYYVLKGRCPIDLLTAVAWCAQVSCSLCGAWCPVLRCSLGCRAGLHCTLHAECSTASGAVSGRKRSWRLCRIRCPIHLLLPGAQSSCP